MISCLCFCTIKYKTFKRKAIEYLKALKRKKRKLKLRLTLGNINDIGFELAQHFVLASSRVRNLTFNFSKLVNFTGNSFQERRAARTRSSKNQKKLTFFHENVNVSNDRTNLLCFISMILEGIATMDRKTSETEAPYAVVASMPQDDTSVRATPVYFLITPSASKR